MQTCYHDELFLKAVYFLFVVHQLFFFTSYKTALVDYSQPVTTHLTVSIAFCLHSLTVYSPSLIYTRSCNWAKTHNPVLINLSSQSRSFSLLCSLRIKKQKKPKPLLLQRFKLQVYFNFATGKSSPILAY